MVYTKTWDETKPAGSRALNLGDDDIREFKTAIRERLQGGGMYFPSTDDNDAGLFNWIKFIEQSGNPTSEANRAFLFTKDSGGVTELYWMDSAGNVNQITTAGKLLLTTLSGWVARGDMIRGGASGWEKLALGASGKVAKSDGTDIIWGDMNFQSEASQAEMEAASDSSKVVTPRRVNDHPGVAKAWCKYNGTGTPAVVVSHNIDASITDNGSGDYTFSVTTDFSSADFVCIANADTASVDEPMISSAIAEAAGTVRIKNIGHGGVANDTDFGFFALYGDQ